jgi:hypothetical protein
MKTDRVLVIASYVAIALAASLWMGPALLRTDIFEGDAAHHVFWLYQYADPGLFPHDISVEYLRTSAPVGYRALYATVAPFMDAQVATKLIALLLLLWTGLLARRLGAVIDGPARELQGLLCVMGLIAILAFAPQADLFPKMAMQRTFALPLTLLCLCGLVGRRTIWVGLSWVFSALFYPALLPTLGLAAAGVFLCDLVVLRRMPSYWLTSALLGVLALALAIFGMPQAPELGPVTTYAQAMTMPAFGPGGRFEIFGPPTPREWIWDPDTGLGWPPKVLIAIVGAIAVTCYAGLRRLMPSAAWITLGAGLAWWLALRIFPEQLMFGLYLPNRHSRWVIGTFGILAFAAVARALTEVLTRNCSARSRNTCTFALATAAPILTLCLLFPQALGQWRQPVDQDLDKTYAYLENLPKQTLVASHPDLANFIPLRARRSVLISTETSMPWMLGYFAKVKLRVDASLRAAYATNLDEVDRELMPFGVNVFVTGPAVWKATRYLEPYDNMVQSLLSRGRKEGFALRHPPQSRILFQSGEYYVVRVGP